MNFRIIRRCSACHGSGSFCPLDCDDGLVCVDVSLDEMTLTEIADLLADGVTPEEREAVEDELRIRAAEDALDAQAQREGRRAA
jgi:hypothetical protein